jgi:hypothetical protein
MPITGLVFDAGGALFTSSGMLVADSALGRISHAAANQPPAPSPPPRRRRPVAG